jgi:F-type H+-transporting ATPase subunit epsilon
MATFTFDLVSPEKLLFSGEVDQVDVPGLEGDFGVLAGHAPIVSALRPGIMTVYVGGQAQRMVVLGGFAEVSADGKLTVLADLADSVEDFDRGKIAERITAQEEKVKELESGNALDRAIERLDHFKQIDSHLQGFKQIDSHLQGTALH